MLIRILCHSLLILALLSGCAALAPQPDRAPASGAPAPGTPPEGMVLVPGGTCVIGSSDGDPDELPEHPVTLSPFYLDIHEVTNLQYRAFIEATGYRLPDFWQPDIDKPDEPVVGVSWNDAQAYARWARKRLPTEAEWEYACREGAVTTTYPWGDTADSARANFNSFGIMPVTSFSANAFGLHDMIGNVWEWCQDWYAGDYYYNSPGRNPQGPVQGTHKVVRGGAWYCDGDQARIANRYYALPDSTSFNVGFRCAQSAR